MQRTYKVLTLESRNCVFKRNKFEFPASTPLSSKSYIEDTDQATKDISIKQYSELVTGSLFYRDTELYNQAKI